MPILQPQGTAGWTFNEPGRQFVQSHRQLPAGNITPESFLNEQIQTGRQQIQDKYALQWREVNRSRRFIGVNKSKNMLRQIDAKAKQEMLAFNQEAQTQMAQINSINRLASQGLIYNADELKARLVFGSDVAKSMYPSAKSPEQQWSQLEIPLNKVESRLAQFRDVKAGEEPEKPPLTYGLLGPLMAPTALAYHAIKERKKKKRGRPVQTQIWDPSMTTEVEDPKTKEMVIETGGWRETTPEEIAEREMLEQEQKRIKKLQADVLERPGIQRRIVQPGTSGGTFSDKITESIPQTRRHDPLGLFD